MHQQTFKQKYNIEILKTTKFAIGYLQHSKLQNANLLQSLLAPLNQLGHFSILARVTSANPSHSAMLMVCSPKLRTPKFIGGGPTLPPAFGTHCSIGNQWCDVDFHPWNSNLELIIALLKQHYNYPSHMWARVLPFIKCVLVPKGNILATLLPNYSWLSPTHLNCNGRVCMTPLFCLFY